MAMKHKTTLPFLLVLFVLLLSVTASLAQEREDPELVRCLESCRSLPHGDERMVRLCEQSCKMEYQKRQGGSAGEVQDQEDPELTRSLEDCRSQPHYDIGMERRCEEQCRKEHQHGKGERRERRESGESPDREDPEQRLTECRLQCQQQYRERGPQKQCERRCEETYRHKRHRNPHRRYKEEEEEREDENPYVFGTERFRYEHRTEHGYVKVLDRFHEKSKFLLGLANYSISILVANPRTFVTPVHFDADCVCYVVKGRGTVTTLRKGEKRSHDIRKGDVFMTPAGSIVYLVSSDRREKLVLAKFLRSISLTGQVSHYHATGAENPESIYKSFSDEVLEAAFNVPRDRIERVFSRQTEGPFVKATEEQIQALSRHAKEGGRWPFGESRGPFNLLQKDPTHSNRYGELYEADSDVYRKLGRLNLRVSLANISEGSMMAPFYHSRSTKLALVTEGSGYVEILCPHLAHQGRRGGSAHRYREHEEEEGEEYQEGGRPGSQYRRVRAHLTRGTVFIVPAGHPVVEVASRDQNLQTICFEIRAAKNERIFLAGRNNILRKMERQAKELAFATNAREVDAVFDAQHEEGFLPGPGAHRQRRGRGESPEWGGSETEVEPLLEVA